MDRRLMEQMGVVEHDKVLYWKATQPDYQGNVALQMCSVMARFLTRRSGVSITDCLVEGAFVLGRDGVLPAKEGSEFTEEYSGEVLHVDRGWWFVKF